MKLIIITPTFAFIFHPVASTDQLDRIGVKAMVQKVRHPRCRLWPIT